MRQAKQIKLMKQAEQAKLVKQAKQAKQVKQVKQAEQAKLVKQVKLMKQMKQVKIISEVGINHNGSMDLARQLIMLSKAAGCDYVKLQKRNPDVCVPEHQKTKPRETPWGTMSYLDYKKRIEFSEDQVRELYKFAQSLGIELFASVWDKDSTDVMARITNIGKIPSALINDLELCAYARSKFETLIVSTGMSSEAEIEACVAACSPDVIMHTNSTYPCPVEDLNLRYIEHLRAKYPAAQIGYSGHEYGLVASFVAVGLGAKWVERHVTLDRGMWGSDQKSSVAPPGLMKLVKGIRDVEKAVQYEPGPRIEFSTESIKKESLRKKT